MSFRRCLAPLCVLALACGTAEEQDLGSAVDHRERGDQAMRRAEPQAAVDAYRACLSLDSDEAACRLGLGRSLEALGDFDTAASELRVAALGLQQPDVWSEVGKVERRRRQFEAAAGAFAHALALDRGHLPSLLGLGQTLIAVGRIDEGEALLERHRLESKLEDRFDALRRAASEPDAAPALQVHIALLQRTRHDLDGARATLERALNRYPDAAEVRLALANHRLNHGSPEQARELILELDPLLAEDPAVLFLKGSIALAVGDLRTAAGHFDASLASGDWPPEVYVDAGRAWLAAGVPKHAAIAFERAAAELADPSDALVGLAESQRKLGDRSQALAAARRARELDPRHERAELVIGVVLAESGDAEGAASAFGRLFETRAADLVLDPGVARLREELAALEPSPAAKSLFEGRLDAYLTRRPVIDRK